MHYRKKERPNPRLLYKGFYIIRQDNGRYNIHDGFLVDTGKSAARLADAHAIIDSLFKRPKVRYG